MVLPPQYFNFAEPFCALSNFSIFLEHFLCTFQFLLETIRKISHLFQFRLKMQISREMFLPFFLDIMIKVKTSAFWVCVSIKVLNKNSNPMIHITLNIWESPSNIWMDAADSSSINQQPRLASILDEIKKETSRHEERIGNHFWRISFSLMT